MKCPKCGRDILDDLAVCPYCDEELISFDKSIVHQECTEQTDFSKARGCALQPPMRWYKFLIKFALVAGAIFNILMAIPYAIGGYDGELTQMYDAFGALKALDIFYAIVLFLQAIFVFYIRERLAGYFINGPKLLIANYALSVTIAIIYYVVYVVIVSGAIDFSEIISRAFGGILMIILNKMYFKKRTYLFVN